MVYFTSENHLCEAHQQAQNKLQTEATFRKQQFDRHRQVKLDTIPPGERVFTCSHPQGRDKIQDTWNPKVYKVVDRREIEAANEVEPANEIEPAKFAPSLDHGQPSYQF